MSELDRIKKHYADRDQKKIDEQYGTYTIYNQYKREERDRYLNRYITEKFNVKKDLKVLEIGAGKGGNLDIFIKAGIEPATYS